MNHKYSLIIFFYYSPQSSLCNKAKQFSIFFTVPPQKVLPFPPIQTPLSSPLCKLLSYAMKVSPSKSVLE